MKIFRLFIAFTFTLICFALSPAAYAVLPAPDGGYPNFNTAEGQNPLLNLTTGAANTAVGWRSLFSNTDGSFNSGFGAGTLLLNTSGAGNTAVGAAALLFSTGTFNTAIGANAGTDPDITSNNVYVGDTGFAGDTNVIAIGGLAASGTPYDNCYIGGIVPQSQATNGVTVCEVTVRLADGRLGIDCTHPSNPGGAPDSTPLRRSRPQQTHARPAMPNGTVGQVQKLEETVAGQQKQIEALTAQLKEQAAQIQKVSAQLELTKAAPHTVLNNQ